MRKWKVFLSYLFILIFVFSSFANAQANSSSYISVMYDGDSQSVRQVPIIMDGEAVELDVPSFITKGATFVPIRFIAERYGALVTWDQATKTAFVKNDNTEIALTIGSDQVYINGQKKTIDSTWIPKLVTFNYGTSQSDSRTMVPLRFISETLGYEVGYDEESRLPYINSIMVEDEDEDGKTNSIKNISVVKGSTDTPKIVVTGTEEINYSTLSLKGPTRFVIDIENAVLDIDDGVEFVGGVGRINLDEDLITRISFSQFSYDPKVVRVVLNLSEDEDFDIIPSEDGKSITISPINRVNSIEKEVVDGKDAIVIHNSKDAEIRAMQLTNPTRIVVDLLDSSLEGGEYFEYDYKVGFVKGVRVSQFVPDDLYSPNDRIVRVVLDVMEGNEDAQASIIVEDNNIIIIPEEDSEKAIDYSKGETESFVTINALEETEYTVEYVEEARTMVIEVPSDKLDCQEEYMSISDGLVNDIVVMEEEGKYYFTISFMENIEYNVLSDAKTSQIAISITKPDIIEPNGRIIVIDAGHGGYDPGAIQNGVKEKDINLPVALKLDEALREKGYTTILTRDKDEYIDLDERANIANENNADIFISIHANSIADPSISGIQVLYCPAYSSDVKETENYPLSEALMDALIEGTGANNKGIIKKTNLVVLRKTKMPAALIEMGFLTNIEEVEKLQSEAYQNLIVESIVKGIEDYFSQMK